MTSRAALLTLFLLLPVLASAQATAASPIDGVWQIAEVTTTGANAATVTSPQPSLLIFARGHYSWVSVNGTSPRTQSAAAKDPASLTEAEKTMRYAEWNPFTANSGTFTTKGNTLTRRLLVAKNVGAMNATNPTVQEFKLEGTTLWLVQKSAAGQPVSETRTKLTRVQ
jgi:hypothetical protein